MASRSVVVRTSTMLVLGRRCFLRPMVPNRNVSLMTMQRQRERVTSVAIQQQAERIRQLQLSWFSDKSSTINEENKPETDAGVSEEIPTNEQKTSTSAGGEVESEIDVFERINQLEEKVKDLNDRLLRSLAEQDNTRRIAKRDVDDARQYAIKSFAKGMLDVADNLDRALKAVPGAMASDKEAHPELAALYEGIEMTERGLVKTFESNGLTKFGQDGEVFDPNKHEALFEYPDSTKVPGTIGQIIKPGFFLNNRVLRPAEVGVIKKQ
jgi:molecular chaperone GrpE